MNIELRLYIAYALKIYYRLLQVFGISALIILPAVAGDVDLTFTTPTNVNRTAQVAVKIGDTRITTDIPAGTSATKKRDLIFDAIDANKVPKFTVEKKGQTGLTIKYLTAGTKVSFDPDITGEKVDTVVAQSASAGTIAFANSAFSALDGTGNPSVFTAGVISNLGSLIFEAPACAFFSDPACMSDPNYLQGKTIDGQEIAKFLADEIMPSADLVGALLEYSGQDFLNISFDSARTDFAGVAFGSTSFESLGVFGSVSIIPEPNVLALVLVALGSLAVVGGRRIR